MEHKTKITAEPGKQDLMIIREFDLPVELVFKAHSDAGLIEQWMGTKVLKLESKKHGSYQLETKDDAGKVLFKANGAIHEFIPNQKIIRTFEMENAPVGVQLELYNFEKLIGNTSKLTIHVLYESNALRDQTIQYGMVQGINMAHKRLEEIISKLK